MRVIPRFFLMIAVTIGAILPLLPSALAQSTEIIANLSAGRAEELLKANEYTYEAVNPSTYKLQIDGLKVLLFNKGNDLQLYVSFKMAQKRTFGLHPVPKTPS